MCPSAISENASKPAASQEEEIIRIRGARTHNLKNIDVDIPRNELVVVTGVSGSGKSSLVFDTLFAEGQRQYVESLSTYARQFFDQLERPDVDQIEGLQPTIAIDQQSGIQNPRSTLATVTEIHDYLRLLMARLGIVSCHKCGTPISQQTPAEIENLILTLPEQSRVMILAPLVRGRKGSHSEALESVRKAGFVRARIDGVTYLLEDVPKLVPQKTHDVEAVVDRVVMRAGVAPRLAESLRLALKHGNGVMSISYQTPSDRAQDRGSNSDSPWHERVFNTRYACPKCQASVAEIEPRTFSFNSPYGACPACDGLGAKDGFDPDLVFPDRSLTLAAGAIAPWRNSSRTARARQSNLLEGFLTAIGIGNDVPLCEWPQAELQWLLTGDGRHFPGVLKHLEMDFASARGGVRDRLSEFRGAVLCAQCNGARLRPEALACRVGGKAIHEITAQTVKESQAFFAALDLPADLRRIGAPLIKEIRRRLDFLEKVGAEYLTLDRPADTLSGGEMQRVRLATGIGLGLVGVLYLLDEPSIGLHPRDNHRLIAALRELQSQGNSVIVVEHDDAMMRAADELIDVGPGAGSAGGRIVAQGSPNQVELAADSVTAAYLSGRKKIPVPGERRPPAKTRSLRLEGATVHNLQDVNVSIPLGLFVGITGVSGSGKSSLVIETLGKALARRLHGAAAKPGRHRSLRGANQLDRVVRVDQAPIGRTPRSNAATYTGVLDEIRKVFAGTKQAKQRGYKSGRFSFNVKGGRCEACQGQGLQKIEMNFLPNLFVICRACRGARFNRQTLSVRYRDRSIADVLEMCVAEAVDFFANHSAIHRLLRSLADVGLGYLTLGQPSTNLSGGEAQRIKLATELGRPRSDRTCYILDEPTTGLHVDDIRRLLRILQQLVDQGNSVVVIEHNLEVLKTADWLIDLGPDGGSGGGRIVITGTPEEVAACETSHTGRFLRTTIASKSLTE